MKFRQIFIVGGGWFHQNTSRRVTCHPQPYYKRSREIPPSDIPTDLHANMSDDRRKPVTRQPRSGPEREYSDSLCDCTNDIGNCKSLKGFTIIIAHAQPCICSSRLSVS